MARITLGIKGKFRSGWRDCSSFLPLNRLPASAGPSGKFNEMNKGKRKGSTFLPAGSGNGLTGTGTMWKPHEGALRVHDWTWGEQSGYDHDDDDHDDDDDDDDHHHHHHHHHNHFYRAYSLTWPASMLIFTNTRKFLHKKRVQFPQGCLGTLTWLPFHCFGTPIWPPSPHVNTLYSLQISLYVKRFHVDAKFWR